VVAKAKPKGARAEIGLAHVLAALDRMAQNLDDVRLVIAEMCLQEKAGARLSVPARPGEPCWANRPGTPCKREPGTPHRKGPGGPCLVRPGEPCRQGRKPRKAR
jgi:hypothetical protein